MNNEIINGSWGVRLTLNCLTVNSNFSKRIPVLLIWESPPIFQQNNSNPSFSGCKVLNMTGSLTSCSLTCTTPDTTPDATPDTSGVKKLGPKAFFDAMFLLALIHSVFWGFHSKVFFFFFNVNHELVWKLKPKCFALVLTSLKEEFWLNKIHCEQTVIFPLLR